jgi:PAS domain S-box-containing protein
MKAQYSKPAQDSLAEAIGVGLAAIDREGRQSLVNEAFCQMVGVPSGELLGAKPPFCYWSESGRSEIEQALELALQGQYPPKGCRLMFRHSSGHDFPVLVHVSHFMDGNPGNEWIATVIDLSELERRAKVAEDQSRSLQALQRVAGLGNWKITRENQFVLSEEARRIVGAGNQVALTLDEVLSRIDERSRSTMRAALVSGTDFLLEFEFLSFSGVTVWLSVAGFPVGLAHGRREFQGTILDITALKKAELDKESSLQMLCSALAAARCIVAETDWSGRINFFSDEEGGVFGVSNKDLLGRHVQDTLISKEDFARIKTTAQPTNGQSPVSLAQDVDVYSKDGQSKIPSFSIAERVQTSDGVGLRLVLVNMAEYRNLERQAGVLQRRQLLGQLTAELTHDFANVLGIIQLHAEQARLKEDADSIFRELNIISAACERGAVIGRSLLAATQDRGSEPKLVNIGLRLKSLHSLLKTTVGPIVSLECEVVETVWAKFDPGAFDSTIINLCVNARDAFGGRPGQVRVTCEGRKFEKDLITQGCVLPPGYYAVVTVEDNGAGIPPENLKQVFNPYFTTKQETKGSGLGLSAVLSFVQSCGGAVRLESEESVGTFAMMYFPVVTSVTEPALSSATNIKRRGIVLVVDDEEELLSAISECLEREGHTVLSTSSGEEADAILQANPSIEILLTDMALPGRFSGVDLYRRGAATRPGLRGIFMSGFAPRFRDSPAECPIIDKPFAGEVIVNAINQLLEKTVQISTRLA